MIFSKEAIAKYRKQKGGTKLLPAVIIIIKSILSMEITLMKTETTDIFEDNLAN